MKKTKPKTYLLRRGLKLKVTGVMLVILAVGVVVIDRLKVLFMVVKFKLTVF